MKPITDPNESKKNYKSIKKNIFPNKAAIDHGVLDESKTYATRLGVGDIGFAKVKPEMIFKGKEISYDNAIVFLMEMKRKEINQAPSLNTQKEIFRTYYALGKIINMLANFMRKKGYNVQAGPALDGDVNYPVLAEEAGLGAIGKHGLLINPKFGPSLRIATLYVDVENLPVNGVNKHLWIKEFSRKCNNCVRKCPGSAIYKETKIFVDRSEQHIDYKKCAVPFSNQYNCTVCVKECSFYKNDYSKIKSRFQRKN